MSASFSATVVATTPTSVVIEIRNGEPYQSPWLHHASIDGREVYRGHANVFIVRGLAPATTHAVLIESGDAQRVVTATTRAEHHRLDVRAFGAVGDGVHDDTAALQAALACCPIDSTVVLPDGDWLSGPLFLKSRQCLELARDARLLGHRDIARWPLLPATLATTDGGEPLVLGTWEGLPATCHASLLNAIGVEDVVIHGEGMLDGNAGFDTWWSRPKTPFAGWRPRTLFIAHARQVTVAGIALRNSPSWTLHALRSSDLAIAAVDVAAPADSPNTDGINPESCARVRITGVHVSTGDDCVGIKAGKRNPDGPPPPPSRDIVVSNSLMENGHGAVVIGSETAGGVHDVLARDCIFRGTDRGFRIKTRRGRGRAAVVDGACLQNVRMQRVGTPFVVNSFYWCDPDGREPHVGDRQPRPVDDGTPSVRNLTLRDVECSDVAHSAVTVLGLPEAPIENLVIDGLRVRYAADAEAGYPDMGEGIEAVRHRGIHLLNVRGIVLRGLDIEGHEGPLLVTDNVE